MGVVFTRMGQDCRFYYELGQDRVFSVGVGWDGNEDPPPCYPLVDTNDGSTWFCRKYCGPTAEQIHSEGRIAINLPVLFFSASS